MNDSDFYKLHKKIGASALNERRKFIGMLPEAYKRGLHNRKPYNGSIHYYAQVLCGLSREQVNRVLNLERRLKKTPKLYNLLVSGQVSHNKLARVASVASPKNDEELAAKVEVLSQGAVETLVRDFKVESSPKLVRAHKLELDEDVQKELIQLQEKGVNINELLRKTLQTRKEDIQKEKDDIAATLKPAKSGYIQVRTQKVLKKEHGRKCSYPSCYKDAVHTHHTDRFAMSKRHNPNSWLRSAKSIMKLRMQLT